MCTDYCSSSTITSSNTSLSSLYVNTPETLLFSASQVNTSLCGSQTLCETSVCGGGSATNSFYPLYYLNTGNNSNNTLVIPPAWITSTEASPFQFRNQVRVGALAVLVALSSGTFLYFLYFSFHVEEAVVGKKEEGSRVSGNVGGGGGGAPSTSFSSIKAYWKKVLTPFNAQLFIIGASLIGMLSDFLFSFNNLQVKYANIGQYIFLSLFELFYIKYSWGRSKNVVDVVVAPWFSRVLNFSVSYLSPLVLIPQVVPPILMNFGLFSEVLALLFTLLPAVAGVWTILFDAILLTAFTLYIRTKTRVDNTVEIVPRFLIVSRFGAATCSLGIASVLLFGVSRFQGIEAMNTLAIGSYALISMAYMVLIGMKVALNADTVRENEDCKTKSNPIKRIKV